MKQTASDYAKIMLVAGEPSGDAHAARLVNDLSENPIKFYGMGGDKMQSAGVQLIKNINKMSVMGIFELITKLPYLYKILFKLKKTLKTHPPDLLILVDYQAFNLKLAKTAKKLNIKTLFYIGPQVWAWRSHRVEKIKKIIDHIAVIFPFEVDFYQKHQMSVTYVGHPLINSIKVQQNRFDFLTSHNISPKKTVIAFLPGSRSSEIINHMPIFKSVILCLKDDPSLVFLVSKYHKNNPNLQPFFEDLPPQTTFVEQDFYEMINAADFAIVASGTATLETALLKTPMIMMVKVSAMSYAIYRRLVKIPFIAIVNIIAGKEVVPELIQESATVQNVLTQINGLLSDKHRAIEMQQGFDEVMDKLAVKPEETLPNLVIKLLEKTMNEQD